MWEYYPGFIILLIANFFLLRVKGRNLIHKYLFLPFFTIAFFAFLLDLYNVYYHIPVHGILKIYVNIFYFLLLSFFILIFDRNWKKPKLNYLDSQKLVKITKLFCLVNAFITIYFITKLSVESNISVINLYLRNPYFLEMNFESNAILGNLLKTNLFNLVLIVGLKLRGVYYKNYRLFLMITILVLIAPNRKGEIILAILAFSHLVFLYKKINFKKLVKIFSAVFGGIVLVFTLTYSFYKTAGAEISVFKKIYTYLTFPIAGSSFLQKEEVDSVYELLTFSPIFNKLNILESKNIAIHSSNHYLNGIEIGNVEGIFSPFYSDFGFIGPILFIIFIGLMINTLELFRRNNFAETLFIIFISFLDLALFGNYFTNNLFLEMCSSFILFYIIYQFRIPTITFKWPKKK
ncbi:MAG TPA: O-antigen polymerase [Bacteroidales bacterium]|nr:O-antigen polymerase [Bacteroidales bacterium]